METIYTKTILYAFNHLLSIAEQIDDLVKKKALSSIDNCSPAIMQYDAIVQLTYEKDVVYALKNMCDKALSKLTEEEMKYFEYKFFRNKPKSYFENFDTSSRAYFRKQNSLIKKCSERFEKCGIDNSFFEEKCLMIDFFRQLLKRTEEVEKKSYKNKPKTAK